MSKFFSTSPELWLRLQIDYDLRHTERDKGDRIRAEVKAYAV